MISGLKIGNFKAFGPAQEIPLRPITLVFGPNSAGKSSIIQSLLLARHIQDTGNVDAHQTTLGGGAVDLGGFARYVHGHCADGEATIRLMFKRADIRGKFEEIGDFKALNLEYTIGESKSGAVSIKSATMLLDERSAFFLVRKDDGSLRVDVGAMRKRLEERRAELEADEDLGGFIVSYWLAVIEELTDAKFAIDGLALKALNPLPRENYDFEQVASQGDLDRPEHDPYGFFTRLFKGLTDEEPKAGVIDAMVRRYEFECLLEAAIAAVDKALKSVSYLGPLRWIPPRLIPDGEQFDASWTAGGGDAWQRLRREPVVLDSVNRFLRDTLHTGYQLRCNRLAPAIDTAVLERCLAQAREKLVNSAAGAAPGDVASARVAEEEPVAPSRKVPTDAELTVALQAELRAPTTGEALTELKIFDSNSGLTVSHRDVGTGISQLLPVIVNAAAAQQKLIAIEQPELHLHPALQAELGDVFIESALGPNKNTFLIETHSEHLILRILRRIRETAENALPEGVTPIRPDDVSVLYVEPGKDGSKVIHLPVNAEGDFDKPWPDGFFAERAKELF